MNKHIKTIDGKRYYYSTKEKENMQEIKYCEWCGNQIGLVKFNKHIVCNDCLDSMSKY